MVLTEWAADAGRVLLNLSSFSNHIAAVLVGSETVLEWLTCALLAGFSWAVALSFLGPHVRKTKYLAKLGVDDDDSHGT